MSEFLNNRVNGDADVGTEIDFADAELLPGGGSTCLVYRTRWQRREVIVKRLREEHRSNPLYLDALDKEYDVGVRLKHPSLPEYREFHRDYIVMDFIDGVTLAEMIARDDAWLKREENVRKMLGQLVEVIDYLHCHNVTHCDIKPDNIMITAKGRNLVLIDFDKCYTDALTDTSGHPGKYGVDVGEVGSHAIDYHGIATVVETLRDGVPGFKLRGCGAFIKECRCEDVSAERLRELLNRGKPAGHRWLLWWLAIIVVAAIAVIALVYFRGERAQVESAQIVEPDTAMAAVADSDNIADNIANVANIANIAKPADVVVEPMAIAQDAARSDTSSMALLESKLAVGFARLQKGVDKLDKLVADSSTTAQALIGAMRRHSVDERSQMYIASEYVHELFPKASENEQWMILAKSKAYTDYKMRVAEMERTYYREIERRKSN